MRHTKRLSLLGASTLLGALALGLASAGGAQAPVTPPATQNVPLTATATLQDPGGAVQGSATFRQVGDGVQITVEARGLLPGQHGMHVHETASCTPGVDAATGRTVPFGGAGGHFDPGMSANHDRPTTGNRAGHGGDLPMLTVGADGVGRATVTTSKLSLRGMTGLLKRTLVIHAQPDDYASDPAGMTGARERCGVILRDGLNSRDYPLPGPQDFPEGVAYSAARGLLYTGSARSGDIYAVNAQSGATSLFSRGGGMGRTSALGLKLDPRGQLWVAGGTTGAVSILSPDGAPVATLMTPPDPNAYLNDLALTPDGAVYVTDSGRPVLWRIGADRVVTPWLDLTGTPIRYGRGLNLNGIVATPDGRYLLSVQLNTGELWRIDTRSKAVRRVMGGLTAGDGLLLDGRTLYAVRNAEGLIVKVSLAADYGSGQIVREEPLGGLRFPTTLAAVGTDLVVVQGQLNKLQGGTPEVPFRLTRFARF